MKEKSKPNFLSVYNCKNNLCLLLIKNPLFQCRFISNNFM